MDSRVFRESNFADLSTIHQSSSTSGGSSRHFVMYPSSPTVWLLGVRDGCTIVISTALADPLQTLGVGRQAADGARYCRHRAASDVRRKPDVIITRRQKWQFSERVFARCH